MTAWLQKNFVLSIHARQVAEHGGSKGLRDEALPESALARPQQLDAYGDPKPDLADLAALAAALAFGLARNHPFVDGNKRTAHVAYRTFLVLNGTDLISTDEDKYLAMMALAEGKLTEHDFAAWLGERLAPLAGRDVHEWRAVYRGKPKPGRAAGARSRAAR